MFPKNMQGLTASIVYILKVMFHLSHPKILPENKINLVKIILCQISSLNSL